MKKLALALGIAGLFALPGSSPAAQADHAPGLPHPLIEVAYAIPDVIHVGNPVGADANCRGYFVLHATCEMFARDVSSLALDAYSDPVPTGDDLEASQEIEVTVTEVGTGTALLSCAYSRTDEVSENFHPDPWDVIVSGGSSCNDGQRLETPRDIHAIVEVKSNGVGRVSVVRQD